MEGGIYLTVKDLMRLTGTNNYFSAAKSHRAIRDAIAPDKRKLTIQEYCKYEGVVYEEVMAFLRK